MESKQPSCEQHPCVKSQDTFDDVGSFYLNAESLTNHNKYEILQNVWKPDPKFPFLSQIIHGKNCKFIYLWLQSRLWLVYEEMLDGALCLPCVLFGRRIGPNASKLDKLMKTPISDWSYACRKFKEHEAKSEVHKTALLRMQTFTEVFENKIKPVTQINNNILDNNVSQNRMKLAPIVKTVLFCARLDILHCVVIELIQATMIQKIVGISKLSWISE